MKQTIKGRIDFLGIAAGNFTQEFNEQYTYSQADQKLTSKTMTITAPSQELDVPVGQKGTIDIFLQQTKSTGTVEGTSRLSGLYTVNEHADGRVYLNIYKKLKIIQELYPELWTVLHEKGISLDDDTKEVVYKGKIGYESINGAKIHVVPKLEGAPQSQAIDVPIKSTNNESQINFYLNGGKDNNLDIDVGPDLKKAMQSLLMNGVKKGWQTVDGKWYYYGQTGDGSGLKEGELAKSWWRLIGGKWYYFNDDGSMVTGWKQIDGKTYYFGNDGAQVGKSGSKEIEGKLYLFDENGAQVKGSGWAKRDGKWYYLNDDGSMKAGWQQDGGRWYYVNQEGSMKTGWLQDNNKWYYFKTE
ncbi:ETX/MTX2 family pore-forming toxin [Bacillus cereus]|uniref:N-acetylmuramoyl-L-alanine amidase family protein n=1 Tax=Bacillus cereus TaxID=1396 RepID=A0A9X7B8S9_BACCE|nr:ETX/MTX2 family pore-forming toxin [Bacillus cereus]PED43154.1 hypothetical protein CON26_15950 [Bacillus cereus]PFV02850.1 hypothetical protein COK98_25825 [Bacillus cereus]